MARVWDLLKIMLLIVTAVSAVEVLSKENGQQEKSHKRTRRDAFATILGIALPHGITLLEKIITDLMDNSKAVQAGIEVDNYSAFILERKGCQIKNGDMNSPPSSVNPGKKEGFAASNSNGKKGIFFMCSYSIDSKGVKNSFHVMVDVSTGKNRLAIAICDKYTAKRCKSLTLDNMSEEYYNFMIRRTYTTSIEHITQCSKEMCVSGTMGNGLASIVKLDFYPQSYQNASSTFRNLYEANGHTAVEYEQFVSNVYKHGSGGDDGSSNAMLLISRSIAWYAISTLFILYLYMIF